VDSAVRYSAGKYYHGLKEAKKRTVGFAGVLAINATGPAMADKDDSTPPEDRAVTAKKYELPELSDSVCE